MASKKLYVRFYQLTVNTKAINYDMLTNDKVNKIQKLVETVLVEADFAEIVFVGTAFLASINLSHLFTESPLILSYHFHK